MLKLTICGDLVDKSTESENYFYLVSYNLTPNSLSLETNKRDCFAD